MKKVCALFVTAVLTICASAVTTVHTQAQGQRRKTQAPGGYYLPKAGFPVLTRDRGGVTSAGSSGGAAGGALPLVNGLHLNEGMDRRPGEGMNSYDPSEPGQPTVRWDQRKFPIKIWISPGQQLPPLPLKIAENDRPTRIHNMLQDPRTYGKFEDLPQCKGFRPEMCDTVAEGIEAWRDLHNEGVVKFAFVDYPQDADVLVFFTDIFPDSTGPGGNRVGAHTTGRAYTAQQIQSFMQQGLARVPVIMEFNVTEDINKMQAEAAHEFGHALGIVAHSPYREDLMYLYRIVDTPSPADKATLRALYRSTPQLWRY
jgi:hypothetical protein